MRRLVIYLFVLMGFLGSARPASADPQFGIFYGKYDAWVRPIVLATGHYQFEFGRLGIGPFIGGGIVADNDDRARYGKTHVHPAIAGGGALSWRLGTGNSRWADWHLTGGLGKAWTLPRGHVQSHAPDVRFFMVGLTKSF